MELDELKERILRWENLHTEFKEWPVHPDDLAAGIVAFANTDGGQLILGIADNRQIVGVEGLDAVERTVDNVAYNNCEPTITIVQEVISIEGKKVIVVHVPKGDERPYRTNRGVYYVRTSSGRRQASREELLRLFQASESLYFDETVVGKTTVDDIDKEYLERFLKEHYGGRSLDDFWVPAEQVMRNLRLVRNNHLTVAGVLLFGKNPQIFLPYAQINAAKFPGTDIADAPEDRKDLGGKLIQQLEDVVSPEL